MNSDNILSDSQAKIKSSEYYKKWYADNKEQKLAYKQSKINCKVCNVIISRNNYAEHKKSQIHLKNIEKLKNDELYNYVSTINLEGININDKDIILNKITEIVKNKLN